VFLSFLLGCHLIAFNGTRASIIKFTEDCSNFIVLTDELGLDFALSWKIGG